MRFILLICILFFPIISCASSIKAYDTQNKKFLSLDQMIREIPSQGIYVLGEFHNDISIQKAQSELIAKKVIHEKSESDFLVNWEFLNYTDAEKTNELFTQFLNDEITVRHFINETAGNQNQTYAVIMEVIKNLGGELRGINLPRDIKQEVIKNGLGSIDPKYVPDFHYDGGVEYKERFVAVMGDHVPADKIDAYFTAQCLTDSVMAEQIHFNALKNLNFVIAGSFHTDFYDATVVRLKKLNPKDMTTFKFINAASLSTQEIDEFTQGDKKYGAYADYIIIVN